MSNYTDAVARGLEGLQAVSTGVCPGCDVCRESDGNYAVEEDDTREPDEPAWTEPDVPGTAIYYATEAEAVQASRERFYLDWQEGRVYSDPSFSGEPCGICGSHFAGDREPFHYLMRGEIEHSEGACVDCVVYLANGDEPEQWGPSND